MPGKTIILETIAREMQTGVMALNREGRVVYANPSIVASFPAHGGMEGASVYDIIKSFELVKTVETHLKARPAVSKSQDIEISEMGRFFSVRIVPLKDKAGFSLLLFFQDITEEKRVETIKRDFVANVSHELRTPLASIKGYSETLLDGGMDEKETQKEFLRIIDRHATRMSRLIDDLLILSRLESHQMRIVHEPVDLKELIANVAQGFQKLSGDKGISVSVNMPDSLPKVSADRDRIEQVVVNLLDNAIKYTGAGGRVKVSAQADGDSWVRVDVSDTGPGIPDADIPRIFERFYRVDKARSRELGGTGLGLAIVKHIIALHNGRLWVESAPGKGSTFNFALKTSA
ncbi:MAG: PAS domain-containing sensor histidine kinase [Deltaproteobacteria bacterium]|nr:PAS domain-containing sensor histidine kinase [Deltaproteobacteria bacterium]